MSIKISEMLSQEDIPAIAIDGEGIITQINEIFQKVYGWEKPNLIGKPLFIIIPEEFHAAHDIGFSRFLKTEKPTLLGKPLALSILHATGGILSAEHTIYAEKNEGKWSFGALIKPMESVK
ncbi:TPA: PAS domain S-box protein [Legionella pneumophila]|nr:PAS domain S-box protein [Legionella pneumophila]HAT8261490.1 PAS domain S-box protein [Legionella pneumophila]HAT8267739.1 PAS domain S-box protein [Legionella pneumophila]HAT8270843.1 PAS domain S-box protein [Legionella pneumophila]HAT8276988.1 PAS domain S-box protein [Legionella pneumophila]